MNRFLNKLRGGEVALGQMVLELFTPGIGPMLAACNLDFVIYDMEHGRCDIAGVAELLASCRGTGITPMARVPDLENAPLSRILDLGAQGVMVPRVETRAQMERVVAELKYPPQGKRGVALGLAHDLYQSRGPAYFPRANEETAVIAIIETVIDDSSPQVLAYVSEKLLEAGAWDVYRVSVQMKKGRTGVQMTVLCRPDLVAAMQDLLFRETTTIGLHWRIENKIALAREFAEVETSWGKVRIKIAHMPGGSIANVAPEYEDCRQLAAQHLVPLKRVMEEAMRAYAAEKENC